MVDEIIIDPQWDNDLEQRRRQASFVPRRDEMPDPFGVEGVAVVGQDMIPDSCDEPPFDPDPEVPVAEPVEPQPPADPFTEQEQDGVVVSQTKRYIGMLLSGRILEEFKRFGWAAFTVGALMLLYISFLINVQELSYEEIRLQRRVKELRTRQADYSARRHIATRRSAIIEELNRRGIELIESPTPPERIE